MPVNFKVLLSKSGGGDILVNGNYVSGSNPIIVERVVLEELDASGATIGIWTERMMMSIDPSPGAYLLYSKPPSGSNVKGARATACYVEIDKAAKSAILNL
jgi:hypothetical protein